MPVKEEWSYEGINLVIGSEGGLYETSLTVVGWITLLKLVWQLFVLAIFWNAFEDHLRWVWVVQQQ